MFGIRDGNYPRTWSEMSFDFKLFFMYHVGMVILIVTAGLLSLGSQTAVVGTLVVMIGVALAAHRRRKQWHWPGIGIKNILGALVTLGLGLFFLGAGLRRVSPLNPNVFPWCAAGAGIILFGVLSELKIVYYSKAEFLRHCGGQPIQQVDLFVSPADPFWKKVVRAVFRTYFIIVWIVGVGFFWEFNTAFQDGTLQPTLERTERLTNHGRTVYITPPQKKLVLRLEYGMMIGIPSALVLGSLVHFVLGVKLFPNTPTLPELLRGDHRRRGPDDS